MMSMPSAALLLATVTARATADATHAATAPALTDLFHQLDARLPHGDYRIPSLVTTNNGTLLAFVAGRMHRTDYTPNLIYLRRSVDYGASWSPAVAILFDPANRTEFGGQPIVDESTGAIHYLYNAANSHIKCSACKLNIITSKDDGQTWSAPRLANTTGPANATWGGGLASGITLRSGPYAGRLIAALRHDCGCGDLRTSFLVFSDDHGETWTGGQQMVLLPQFGGGWTECQAAELQNGSVLMTSRNFYGTSSGQGPRLFARSDDGGATWAANWSAGADLVDPYCEASLVSDTDRGILYFGNPSAKSRSNFSIHTSTDGGRSWPKSVVVYPGGAAYSDLALSTDGKALSFVFERDNYNTVTFGNVPVPLQL